MKFESSDRTQLSPHFLHEDRRHEIGEEWAGLHRPPSQHQEKNCLFWLLVHTYIFIHFIYITEWLPMVTAFSSCSSSWQRSVWNFAVDLKYLTKQLSNTFYRKHCELPVIKPHLPQDLKKKKTVKEHYSAPPFLETDVTNVLHFEIRELFGANLSILLS